MITRRHSLAGLAALPWVACGRRRPPVEIRVVAMPYLQMASLFLAEEAGYFSDEGLRIQIKEYDRSQVAIPLLAAGEADAAIFGPSPTLINAVDRGARVRIVAARHSYSTQCPAGRRVYGSRVAFPDGFTDLRQMKGKRASLGRSNTGIGAYIWSRCVAAAGLSESDISMLASNSKEGSTAMLVAGKIDILLPAQDFDIGLTSLRERIVFGPAISSVLPNFQYSFITFGKRFLDDSFDDGVRFLRAYYRGARAFLAGTTPKFVDRIIETDKLDAPGVRGMCREGLLTSGRIQMDDLQRFVEWSASQQLSPASVRAEQMVDLRFLEAGKLA